MVVHIAGMARQVPLPNVDSFPFEEAVSIQDQQNQTLNHHDCGHPCHGKRQRFPRLMVTRNPLDLHGQCHKVAAVTPIGS
jgi:hypothetical protein